MARRAHGTSSPKLLEAGHTAPRFPVSPVNVAVSGSPTASLRPTLAAHADLSDHHRWPWRILQVLFLTLGLIDARRGRSASRADHSVSPQAMRGAWEPRAWSYFSQTQRPRPLDHDFDFLSGFDWDFSCLGRHFVRHALVF